MTSEYELTRPSSEYLAQIKTYRDEFADCFDWLHGAQGLKRFEEPRDWLDYLALCENDATVPEGEHKYSQFIYVRTADKRIVGMIGVRHKPVGPIDTWGGHVGYSVSPSERMKGHATHMLHEVLPYCKSLGLNRVLLTAGDENVGSVKTIIANGGVLESHVMSPKHHVMVGRYWIELPD